MLNYKNNPISFILDGRTNFSILHMLNSNNNPQVKNLHGYWKSSKSSKNDMLPSIQNGTIEMKEKINLYLDEIYTLN